MWDSKIAWGGMEYRTIEDFVWHVVYFMFCPLTVQCTPLEKLWFE
jgi:hypothetical protein